MAAAVTVVAAAATVVAVAIPAMVEEGAHLAKHATTIGLPQRLSTPRTAS